MTEYPTEKKAMFTDITKYKHAIGTIERICPHYEKNKK